MILTLLLCAILLQGDPQTALKPVIENDRVAVWDVTESVTARPLDAVVVYLSGSAAFLPKSAMLKSGGQTSAERSIVIDLKDHSVAPLENPTKLSPGRGPDRRRSWRTRA